MNWREVVLVSKVFALITWFSFPLLAVSAGSAAGQATEREESLVLDGEVGDFGGQLIVAERSEPKTFNPVISTDNVSRSVIRRLTADLVHISNRETHETESSLAKSWEVTPDGRRYTLHLREGIRFSDGHFFDADDVVFTFRVYLDEEIHSPSQHRSRTTRFSRAARTRRRRWRSRTARASRAGGR